MTIIHVALMTPLTDGTLTPAVGVLKFTPTARRTITGTPDNVVLPAPFQVSLVAGLADITLAPTAAGWAWRVDERIPGAPSRTVYVTVPDVVELDYAELVAVDPGTLTPGPPLAPGWVSSLSLSLARTPEAIITGAIIRDGGGAPTSAAVVWPDGTTGVFTGTPSMAFPGSLDAYTITYGTSRTYTQPAVTRNPAGEIITQPVITVS